MKNMLSNIHYLASMRGDGLHPMLLVPAPETETTVSTAANLGGPASDQMQRQSASSSRRRQPSVERNISKQTDATRNEDQSAQALHRDGVGLDQPRYIDTGSGLIKYVDRGNGPVTLVLHEKVLNEYLWQNYITAVASERRCITLDIGDNPLDRTNKSHVVVALGHQALMVRQLIDALKIAQIDLVTNDGAARVARSFATTNPQMVRSFMRTNGLCFPAWSGS